MSIAQDEIPLVTLTFKGVKEPRLRFDKTTLGLVKRLQTKLANSIPDGRTVVTTITAPIRQDSKTSSVLEGRIQELLATGRGRLKTTIYGNRIQVRVLKGGAIRTAKLIGFVHNPELSRAREYSQQMRERGELRSSRLARIAKFFKRY